MFIYIYALYAIYALIIIVLYWYGTRTFNYWKMRGVKHDYPLPFVGNNLKQFLQKVSMGMMANEMYRKYPEEKVVGFFRGPNPEVVVRDPEIARRILVTDFNCFHSRRMNPHRTVMEPLMRNIIVSDGDLWRLLRQRLTPAFSPGKLKAMFPLITKSAEKLQVITEEITKRDVYDAHELMARYTIEVIGECAFGINMESLSEENNQFRKLGKRIFRRNFRDNFIGALKWILPELCKNLYFFAPELEVTMLHLFQAVAKERGGKPSGRNDFIDQLLEAKEKGNMIGESIMNKNPDGTTQIVEFEIDDLVMTAQMFAFFGAGYETSATTLSHTLHQLAFYPECQVKVQEEIDRVLANHGNKITYNAIKEMKYLEMVLFESIRMYPSVGYLMRACNVPEYTFPELNLTITEGVRIIVPIAAIHTDEKNFRNADKFDPERFQDGFNEDMRKFIFLPFGEGPRTCIGARLGQMQSMAGLVAILQKYSVEPVACSKRVPDHNPAGTITEGFFGGIPLKFKKRVLT